MPHDACLQSHFTNAEFPIYLHCNFSMHSMESQPASGALPGQPRPGAAPEAGGGQDGADQEGGNIRGGKDGANHGGGGHEQRCLRSSGGGGCSSGREQRQKAASAAGIKMRRSGRKAREERSFATQICLYGKIDPHVVLFLPERRSNQSRNNGSVWGISLFS